MFRLRTGYVLSGIATGLVLLFGFISSLPDGKLHIVFCDVGQGDGIYIRFPDGRDMVVDGGPNDKILGCLSEYMPFWDRQLDIVVLTHPQKDHMQGLLTIFERYEVGYFVRSNIANNSEGYKKLLELIKTHNIKEKFVTSGETITVGQATLHTLWPSNEQIGRMQGKNPSTAINTTNSQGVLGVQSAIDLNDGSIVVHLEYGNFDAVLTGDADTRVEREYRGAPLGLDPIEVLKVPHHGSKTGMTTDYLDWLKPNLAIISVGKNSYGHPTEQILELLRSKNIMIRRTDQEGNIEVVSDGRNWAIN